MKKMILIAFAIVAAIGSSNAKNLLEKSIYFLNPTTKKIENAKYWKVFLGSYPGTLSRKFPGEDTMMLTCDLNFTLLSSGYVEGYGYTRKGRVDCEADIMAEGGSARKIVLDSVEYVFNNGKSIKMKNGAVLNTFLDVEGNKVTLHKPLTLTKYNLRIEYEERNLKPAGDAVVRWFAFSKSAIAAAQKADKATESEEKSEEPQGN